MLKSVKRVWSKIKDAGHKFKKSTVGQRPITRGSPGRKGSRGRKGSPGRIPVALRPWTNALSDARSGNGGRGVSSFKFNGRSYKKSTKKIGGRPVYYRVCSGGKRCKSKKSRRLSRKSRKSSGRRGRR